MSPFLKGKCLDGVEVVHVEGPLFFGVAGDLLETFNAMGQRPRVLILHMRQVSCLDISGASAFMVLLQECRSQNIHIIISSLQPQPRQILGRIGFKESLVEIEQSVSFQEALEKARLYLKLS